MPLHKSFQKYTKACRDSKWKTTDYRSSTPSTKDSDRFTAFKTYCHRQFSVCVIFDQEHPDFPPDLILEANAEDIAFGQVQNLLPDKWKNNGDQALLLLLDEIQHLHKASQKGKMRSVQNSRIVTEFEMITEMKNLEVEVVGQSPETEATMCIPLSLKDKTNEYLLEQIPTMDSTDGFYVYLSWAVESSSIVPSKTEVVFPADFREILEKLQNPTWGRGWIIDDYLNQVNSNINRHVRDHRKQTEQRKELVEGLMRSLGGRSLLKPEPLFRAHEYDDLKWDFVSFYFDCGKTKQAAIVRIDCESYPNRNPVIICQSTEFLDKENSPMQEEIGYHLPYSRMLSSLLKTMKERIVYRVPMLLKEMETKSERLKLKQQQKEEEAKQQEAVTESPTTTAPTTD